MILAGTLLSLLVASPVAPAAGDDEPAPARYVRIVLPGPARILSLAEVEVLSAGESIGQHGRASQSSVASGGEPQRANDGNTSGVYTDGSVTHTQSDRGSWWEVDLGQAVLIDEIVVWNRSDCCEERLQGFTVQLLDKRHRLLWERTRIPAARQTQIVPFTEAPPPPEITGPGAEERRAFQPRIDNAIDTGVEFLLSKQMWDGSFRHHTDFYPAGSTGLALYTLLKCEVPKDHPAVRRAVEFLLANPPSQTYGLGTVLMAFGALGDPEYQGFMQELLDVLLSYQGTRSEDGRNDPLWAYPIVHSETADLSNSQYAALGLRAAQRAGLKVPTRVWTTLADAVLRYQQDPQEVEDTLTRGTTSGKLRIAGFPYRIGGPASGSMTTAGLGILGICGEGLGEFPSRLRRKAWNGRRHALAWLAYNFTVEANVGGGENWLLYYLYGLERVGALLDVDHIGPHDWYWEGAKAIVPKQAGNGSWSTDNESDTCFALLFLRRATAGPSTGVEQGGAAPEGSWLSEGPELDVQWRITGGKRAVFFVSGFSEVVQTRLALGQGSARGLRVVRVDYLVEGETIAILLGDPARKWAGERFAARHDFTSGGEFRCEVRVVVQEPGEIAGIESTSELLGEPLVVEIEGVHDESLLEYPSQAAENLLRNTQLVATSSTVNGAGQEPPRAVDGRLGTSWMCSQDDPLPRLTLELGRAQRGRVLYFSQVNVDEASRGACDRATRVRVVLNGKEALTFELDAPETDEGKIVLELEKTLSLRRVEVTILARATGSRWPGHVGISEVEWLPGR